MKAMTPADLSPKDLDRLACDAVGIEAIGWGYLEKGKNVDRWDLCGPWIELGSGVQGCGVLASIQRAHDRGDETEGPFEIFPSVSEEPAACAVLEEAAMRAGAGRIETVVTPEYTQAQVNRTRIWSRVFLNESNTQKYRAVALAVVAWAEAKEAI